MRSFYGFLDKRGLAHNASIATIQTPKLPRSVPKALSERDMGELLDADPAEKERAPWIELRDQAVLLLLYGAGLRIAEALSLTGAHLPLGETLLVTGKGGKQRVVPVGSHARNALSEWRQERPSGNEAFVFPGRGEGPISQRAVQIRIKQLAQRQGLFKHVHPHMLRHSFASHILESSGDLRGVQELLGHADIATTQIYTHVSRKKLSEVYQCTHPSAEGGSGLF